MHRIVIDTNLYIDWINAGHHEEVFFHPQAVKYLSTVVMMELLAGAYAWADRARLARLIRTYRQADRLLLPSTDVYEQAGHVLRQLHTGPGWRAKVVHGIMNDVLIAMSARAIGATVITQNASDFQAIHGVRPFKLHVVSHP